LEFSSKRASLAISMASFFGINFGGSPEGETPLAVTHENVIYKILVKRSPSARRITLRVRLAARDVIVTIPKRASIKTAQEFAQRHAPWIATRLGRLPRAVPFRTGEIIPIRGENHRIVHKQQIRGWVRVEQATEEDLPWLHVACDEQHIRRRISDFLKENAKSDLESAVRKYTQQLGYASRKVTVKDTSSRWGSCSASGALSFSWRLILAPSEVLDYLAAHEVAHLVHMNHSTDFWDLTRKLAPHTDNAEAWLIKNGASLYRFGAKA
jgi:predicted metal-dependent hydrolase